MTRFMYGKPEENRTEVQKQELRKYEQQNPLINTFIKEASEIRKLVDRYPYKIA
jgi:hypothetical protein